MRSSLAAILVATGTGTAAITVAQGAHADQVGYLVNVHSRPGYNFADAKAALDYGYSVCDRVAAKTHFADLVNRFWQLRQSVNAR